MDCRGPSCLRQEASLSVGNSNERSGGECIHHELVLEEIETPVQCGKEGRCLPREQRKRLVADMEMQNIKVRGATKDVLQHQSLGSARVTESATLTGAAWPHGL
jgi:hypothetical protein